LTSRFQEQHILRELAEKRLAGVQRYWKAWEQINAKSEQK
jgi:hypothetical protein